MMMKRTHHDDMTTMATRRRRVDRAKRPSPPAPLPRGAGRRRAFTLTEALLSIGLLLVILLFVGRIFGTVSNVSTAGAANADIMQEIAAMERQMRADFERLSKDGFFVIVSTAVRNDIHDSSLVGDPERWLDPSRARDEFVRSDRLLFFTQGVQNVQVFRGGQGINRKPQSSENRVYYGHGFQYGDVDDDQTTADNVASTFGDLPPWHRGNVDFEFTDIASGGSAGTGMVDIAQPGARSWTLARQNILLSDDGGGQDSFGTGQAASVVSIWDNLIRNARVDAAAWQLNDIRGAVIYSDYNDRPPPFPTNFRDWDGMRDDAMRTAVFYPRAQRQAQTMSRIDHATSINTLGTGVSDFIVEWTYPPGSTGFVVNQSNQTFAGVSIPWSGRQPWFGLPDDHPNYGPATPARRGVFMLGDEAWWTVDNSGPVFPGEFENVQTFTVDGQVKIIEYVTVFGYNQTRPLDDRPASASFGQPWTTGSPGVEAYTPWPSAIRITMRVHDPNVVLERGREVQFVFNLPKRTE